MVAVLVRGTLRDALNAFWPTTIVFYLIAIAFAAPLLLSEDHEKPGIDWLQTLDLVQLGILTLSAYLVFFYIPVITGLPDAARVRYFMILHLTRDGFLALGYLYRGWRSRHPDFRRLLFRLSAFFAAFSITASLYLQAMNVWRWPQLLVAFVADLPVLFLLVTAAIWQQREMAPGAATSAVHRKTLWAQGLSVIMPLSVLAVASRVSSQYLRMAWIAATASLICYAARLFVMQRSQEAALSKLLATEEKFTRAFQSSPVAIAISRLSDGAYVDANDRWLELTGLTREQVIGRTSVQLGVFENSAQRNLLVAAIREQGSFRGMNFTLRLGGRVVETVVSAEVIEFDGEQLVISSILDVSELRDVTRQLHQAQRMELVGSLAGGVAHDFNNLLTIIKGYCEIVRDRKLETGLAEEIRQIADAADRASALTRQLLAFSRRQVLQPRNVALNPVVVATGKMLHRTLGENIDLATSFTADLGTVHVDPVQIDQVVMNLAINARDAMPNGGKLVFETRNLELADPYPQRGFEIPAGRYVVLGVTDTGTGILPEHLDRIFEPFFTTKEVGSGTGLGLSTVYGIVKQSGGYISVDSKAGLGTTFNIYLPRVDEPAETLAPALKAPRNLHGTETVLVVEDDRRVCTLTANILGQHGYKVIPAVSAEEALARAGDFEGEIHLLLTDIVMARTNGRELAQRLKEQRPGLRVLYMSGYPHFSLSGAGMMDFRETILAKPFTPSELVRAIRTCLDCEVHGEAKSF